MIEAKSFVETAKLAGFSLYTGVPCSYVKPFINYVIDAPDLTYIGATNEGDAVAIATGAELGGKRAIVMMQNSGLGNAVSPLTSLNAIFRIPMLLIVTLRGEPGGPHDEPQHELMGAITTKMLETMNVALGLLPARSRPRSRRAIEKAVSHMTKTGLPFCLVMKKDSVAPHKLATKPVVRSRDVAARPPPTRRPRRRATDKAERPSREEALRAVQRAVDPSDIVDRDDRLHRPRALRVRRPSNQLYMVGSMGCASSIGLGLAWARPDRRVIVLDGDGAMLMRLGALATLGYERPEEPRPRAPRQRGARVDGRSVDRLALDGPRRRRARVRLRRRVEGRQGRGPREPRFAIAARPALHLPEDAPRRAGRSPAPEGHAARGRRAHPQGAGRRHGRIGLMNVRA